MNAYSQCYVFKDNNSSFVILGDSVAIEYNDSEKIKQVVCFASDQISKGGGNPKINIDTVFKQSCDTLSVERFELMDVLKLEFSKKKRYYDIFDYKKMKINIYDVYMLIYNRPLA